MKKNTVSVTVNISPEVYPYLCQIAKIANRSVEAIILETVEPEITQTYESRDLDCLIPFFTYTTRAEAEKVCKAANEFWRGNDAIRQDRWIVIDEDGGFRIDSDRIDYEKDETIAAAALLAEVESLTNEEARKLFIQLPVG